MGQQTFARFGQPDASGRTGKEWRAYAFLKAAYPLADRGWRDTEVPCRRSEALALSHGQKHDKPIQMSASDC
ncbi:hypothetical protein GCM10007863_21890 [Dyella mobilis]|nr:hypothetical protein GCM10007863_21890 [Dyella mobilis]